MHCVRTMVDVMQEADHKHTAREISHQINEFIWNK